MFLMRQYTITLSNCKHFSANSLQWCFFWTGLVYKKLSKSYKKYSELSSA